MYTLTIRGQVQTLDPAWVMGIINVTPDSFFAGSRSSAENEICARAAEMRAQGANIIDIGGYSTRPGCDDVNPHEELRRLALGCQCVRRVWPAAIISVDTFRADVAKTCVEEYGADIINDISGGDLDPDMFATVARLQVPYVLMHTRGTPQDMQCRCQYDDVAAEVMTSLAFKAQRLAEMGAADIILDPGFGFAKDVDQNFRLLSALDAFKQMGYPLLVGISRKSMIFRTLETTPAESLNGTTVLNTFALMHGADILRVHDVREARQAVILTSKLKSHANA